MVADRIIGDRLQCVGAREKGRKLWAKACLILGEARKFAPHTGVRLGRLARGVEYVGLRRMERGQIGGASRRFREIIGQNDPRLVQ